jgi:hypothetical protein
MDCESETTRGSWKFAVPLTAATTNIVTDKPVKTKQSKIETSLDMIRVMYKVK